jgi:peptide/nickel transport system permease protein
MLQYSLRKLLAGIPLILGVTLVSFLLMVYFGPDQTYQLLGKNPTPEQIAETRASSATTSPSSRAMPTTCASSHAGLRQLEFHR